MHYILPVILCMGMAFPMGFAQGPSEKLPSAVNTAQYDETTPVLSRNGDRLFFTRTADPAYEPSILNEEGQISSNKTDAIYQDHLAMIYSQISGHKITDPTASVYIQDIWFVTLEPDSIGEAVHPGYPLNNALPNSLVSVGTEPDEYILINQFMEDGSMYSGFSRASIDMKGQSLMPRPMHIYGFDLSGADVDLTMTPDGHILVLSMERPDGLGHHDLYVSFFIRDNVWSAPMHMGSVINTSSQESSPHISPDKRFMYFSSDRPGGAGGSDIYVSERLNYSWLKWSTPVPVKGDVNTQADESQPYFDAPATYLYFTSRKDGSSDIYRQLQAPKPELKKPLFVRGKIVDATTGQAVHSELFWGQHSSEDYLEYFNSYTGDFEITLTEAEPYKFLPRKANHTAQRILIDPRGMEKQGIDTLNLILYLVPKKNAGADAPDTEKKNIQVPESENEVAPAGPETMTFYNINFIKGKSTILTRSRGALNDIYQKMIDNPTLEIMITGHTDNVGDEAALIDLSMDRALAIKGYLVHEGIDGDRMQVSGKGATLPLYQNGTESGREKNRRVEITLLKL